VDKIVVGASGHMADVVASLTDMLESNKTAANSAQSGHGHKFEFVDHNEKQKYLDLGGSHIAREVGKHAACPPACLARLPARALLARLAWCLSP
jgi:hypothetical protein